MARHVYRVRVRSRVDGRVLFHVAEREARIMCAEDSHGNPLEGMEPNAMRLSRKKAPLTDIQLKSLAREEETSACSITRSESHNNAAGSLDPTLRQRLAFIDADMCKVEAWPETHDDRNFVISAGVPYGVFCPWPQQEERVVTFA